ncbi:hypothetical protein QT969_10465 [Rhodococcus sp. CSLK01-03]|uniref:Head-to-tail stopper n=1 Tax=Rhodococcus indonesiensis TaxID=3055869 RepID=A0ABT7RN54_9NOCA|nr:hypothetical protein [Rhodococcus indonesiensis]MDM7488714.1 hypothetical protein [Rhodococcus indonesiensis]
MTQFSLTVPVQVERYSGGVVDELGNETEGWSAPESVLVFGWEAPVSAEQVLAGHERVVVDVKLYAGRSIAIGPRDHITLDGKAFEVVGYPQDPNNNPWWQPGLVTVLLRSLEG